MKHLFFICSFSLLTVLAFGQGGLLDPVKWTASLGSADDSNQVKLIFVAKIDEGWKLYSQNIEEGGPIPTTFYFNDSLGGYKLNGKVKELGRLQEKPEPLFDGMTLKWYEKRAVFKQTIDLEKNENAVQGFFEYMTCDQKRCLPPRPVFFKYQNGNLQLFDDEGELSSDLGESDNANKISSNTPAGKLLEPVKWLISSQKESNGLLKIIWTAKIDDGWKLYSQKLKEGGPIPTTFIMDDSLNTYALKGGISEIGEVQEKYEKLFEMDLRWYEGQVQFVQLVDAKNAKTLNGIVEFMTCDHKRCLPPQSVSYRVDLINATAQFVTEADTSSVKPEMQCGLTQPISNCGKELYNALGASGGDDEAVTTEDGEEEEQSANLWYLFVLGLGGGLIAVIMPCIYPMIPLTVSFFTKGATSKKAGMQKALLYGLSIILIFILLGVVLSLLFGPDVIHKLSTGLVFNLLFFVIFIIFALSFFGMFEITLPSGFVNRMDSMSDKGGIIGIFFMAFTLVLVSFSCTVPIVGSLLVEMAKYPAGAIVGMFGFSLALALPFTLFAAFPSWLTSMPKSGGWLNTVKVVIGFVELAFAFKFLSNADMVYQWGLLKYETFVVIWAIIAIATGLYLFGVIKFPSDGKVKLGIGRIAFALLFIGFGAYLGQGLVTNSYLKLVSGLTPPKHYAYGWFEGNKDVVAKKCPLGIDCHKNDFDASVATASQKQQPILVDFTGWACANCRKMEEYVWPTDEIEPILRDQVVVTSLYVDERKIKLDKEQARYSPVLGRTMKYIGDLWTEMEICKYEQITQPLYVMIHPNGTLLNYPVGYTNKEDYLEWLNCGLNAYKQMGNTTSAK